MNTKLQIIGLSGTNGAGKDLVGELLAKYYGYFFISVTELLRAEARRRGEPVEREVLRTVSAEWRRESGLGVLIDKAVAEYEKVKDQYVGVAIASLRNPGESDEIHKLGGTLVWVDAAPRIRYDRIQANKATRNRAEEDNKTFEQFLAEEETEMHHSGDEATLNMAGVKAQSDITLINDSSDFDTLRRTIETSLGILDVTKSKPTIII